MQHCILHLRILFLPANNMKLQPYKTLVISVIISLVLSLVLNVIPFEKINSQFWYLSIIYHLLLSLGLFAILFRKEADPKDMVNKIMFTSMGRLLFCMIGIFIYSMVDKPSFIPFAAHFMAHYIIFTILEIKTFLQHIKSNSHE